MNTPRDPKFGAGHGQSLAEVERTRQSRPVADRIVLRIDIDMPLPAIDGVAGASLKRDSAGHSK